MTNRAARQRFSIGYHLNSWDLTGQPLRPAIKFLAEQGFGWFEILAFTSLSDQYARKYMQLGNQPPMGVTTDTDILRRFAVLSEAQSERGIRLSSLYVNAIFTNPVAWPYERDVLGQSSADTRPEPAARSRRRRGAGLGRRSDRRCPHFSRCGAERLQRLWRLLDWLIAEALSK
jgi:hypothetical protein